MTEVMKRIGEVIVEHQRKLRNKDVKKELIFKLDDEEDIIIWNTDDEYEEFILIMREIMNLKILSKEDDDYQSYFTELIKDIEVQLYKLRENMNRDNGGE